MMEVIAADTPRWLAELERQCRLKTQTKVGKEIGYSSSVVSQVRNRKYEGGNLEAVAARIRSVYLGETVMCPVTGELEKHLCQQFQKEPYLNTNLIRRRRYKACRSGCINSQIEE
jgi:hypothetical protein